MTEITHGSFLRPLLPLPFPRTGRQVGVQGRGLTAFRRISISRCETLHINEEFLRSAFIESLRGFYDRSGIEIPVDRLNFEIYQNPRGVDTCQGRVFYRGPVTPEAKKAWPRIKLDLTADEIIAETPVIRPVRRDYSDGPPEAFSILSYSYVEVFAEKIRALKERTRPRDLYGVINFFRRPESRDIAEQVRAALERKCDHKSSFPRLSDLESQKSECSSG
ncbi:MAG: nucleotidyl transferase AbiEii/AbiGii toxin family protein [Chloracidobacterium sp.]|nr:nucleotidyl transferase AbiEii/AbiGii toxin family protein [Chloracidobacterium sp.]